MTARSQRRAAARKAAKLAKKQSAQSVQPRVATATAQGYSNDETPPHPLDPVPPRPVPSHLLDPIEEGHVELSDFGQRHLDRLGAEFAAKIAAREAAEAPDKKPISEAQLAANRANAQKSSGPTSDTGKANSSRNNFRHGLTQTEGDLILLENESKDEYSQSLADFQKEWKPVTATERDLVERLASRQWLRRRAMRLQRRYVDDLGYIIDYQMHSLYRRYEMTHERGFNKALADLMRLRSIQIRERNGFESQRRKNAEHEFKIRSLQNREKLQDLAIRIAEARLKRLEPKETPPPPGK
jgi:hypothetical protein